MLNKLLNKQRKVKRKRLKYHLKRKNYNEFPRLIIIRSNKNIFTQLIDDVNNRTILASSSIDKELKGAIGKAKSKIEQSMIVGKSMAEKMKKANIDKIIFDRNGYNYHGRVKALAEAVREMKIKF